MQAGSRMTTELARQGLLQVQIFETDDDQHVVDAIENLDPVAVTSLFPLSGAAVKRGASSGHTAHRDRDAARTRRSAPFGRRDAGRTSRLARSPTRSRSPTPGSPNGAPWATTGSKASRARRDCATFRPSASARSPLDNAADVVTGWVREGVTAVCAQSDEIACLVLYGIHEARLRCPRDLAVIGVDASPMGVVSTPPLTTVEFNPARGRRRCNRGGLRTAGTPSANRPPSQRTSPASIVRSST